MFNNFLTSMKSSARGHRRAFSSFTSLLASLTLLPIYTFLLLYYRGLIRQFFIDVFSKTPKNEVATILNESRIVVQSYMIRTDPLN